MNLTLPGEDDVRRRETREWLAGHVSPTGRDLAEAGFVAPHWPRPWGLGADPVHQLIIDDELRRAGVRRPENPIGIGWAGPTIIHAGTHVQKQRYLLPLLAGEELWCQLFRLRWPLARPPIRDETCGGRLQAPESSLVPRA